MLLHRLLLLCALLPGLLFSSGVSVRVCLHALLGMQADCAACRAEVSPCCGERELPAAPFLAATVECAACCLDLEAAAQRLGVKERSAHDATTQLAAPFAFPGPPTALAHQAAPPPKLAGPRASPAARGILPLRI